MQTEDLSIESFASPGRAIWPDGQTTLRALHPTLEPATARGRDAHSTISLQIFTTTGIPV